MTDTPPTDNKDLHRPREKRVERRQSTTFIDSIKNKNKRKRLRIQLSISRASLRKYGLDVEDFSEDELVATIGALNACAKKADIDVPSYLILHRKMYEEHGARKFVAWMQMIASSDQPLPSMRAHVQQQLADMGIVLEDPTSTGIALGQSTSSDRVTEK